jgi:two-component system nitrogen regulation sensor histidine kinase NtrY
MRGRRAWRQWWLPLSGALVLALAAWARVPAPNIAPRTAAVGPADSAKEAGRIRVAALAELRRGLRRSVAQLDEAARNGLSAPAEPEAAFRNIPGARAGDPEWGLIVYDAGQPLAWSGRLRIPTDTIRTPVSIAVTPFYTILIITAERGARRSVATMVVHAVQPADRIAHALVEQIPERVPIAGFTVNTSPGVGDVVLAAANGAPLLWAEPIQLSAGELRLAREQRARQRIAIGFGIVLIAFLVVSWRIGATGERLAALAVALAALAIVPFNTFSSEARLFDPTYYFSRAGGPWTANAGVLLLAALIVFFAVLALVRGRPRVRDRTPALIVAIALLVLGYPIVRALSDGIGQPARGATIGLWLSWQIPLFLAIAAILLPAAWVIDTGIQRRRRITPRSFLLATAMSGTIAASLVWLTTVGQRIRLAETDIAALNGAREDQLTALVVRYSQALAPMPPVRDEQELLRRYGASELALAEYPFGLTSWNSRGEIVANLDLTHVVQDTLASLPVLRRALSTQQTQIVTLPGPAGATWIAAVPHRVAGQPGIAGVTVVTARPRSRALELDPFAPLLGVSAAGVDEPPYSITIAEDRTPPRAGPIRWGRIGNELHADAPLITSAGPARAHLEIDLRSPETLAQRLVLVVLLDIAIAALLLLLVRAAERGFARRARVRLRHWTSSYRFRLTLALFAFFVIPASAFAIWGYRRLAADNRHSRELIVRETLHAASGAWDEEPLAVIAWRLGTPLFAYEQGLISTVSEPLLEVLAPLGRALPPEVHLNLNVADELSASWEEHVGGVPVLVGYRSVSFDGRRAVLAAPSRGTDALLARRAGDLAILLLFATAVGALAALWLSGVAAHQFGRPISALRRAARAVARGERRPPQLPRASSEFEPVFTAFRRMAADLERNRTELARAERVLAWGEMARQVAHEIKNPLTPIRLGVQHLQRSRNDPRVDFDRVFEANTRQILSEIERLDEIARAFSRYGSAPTDLPPAVPVDVASTLRDLIAFEQMGEGGVAWALIGTESACHALARREELREVLMNVFENARAAGARSITTAVRCDNERVQISVEDDGSGIPLDVLPRIFEPHFSTRTTGSGLGLAISRRLLDSWGGSIEISSEPGRGTRVEITLRAAPRA